MAESTTKKARAARPAAVRRAPSTSKRVPAVTKRVPAASKRVPRSKKVAAAVEAAGRQMSDEHKAALAAGREEGRVVRNYLEAVSHPKRPGRKKTPDSIQRQMSEVDGRLRSAGAAERLQLIQQRFDLKSELDRLAAESSVDLNGLEASFVKVAASYSDRKGLSYGAWREAGVAADVLRRAGVKRTRS